MKVTILSLNSFFFTCSHLGFFSYFPSVHSINGHRLAPNRETASLSLILKEYKKTTALTKLVFED